MIDKTEELEGTRIILHEDKFVNTLIATKVYDLYARHNGYTNKRKFVEYFSNGCKKYVFLFNGHIMEGFEDKYFVKDKSKLLRPTDLVSKEEINLAKL